jgi:hypothetical protein
LVVLLPAAIAVVIRGATAAEGKSDASALKKDLDRAERVARWAPLPRGFIGMNFSILHTGLNNLSGTRNRP